MSTTTTLPVKGEPAAPVHRRDPRASRPIYTPDVDLYETDDELVLQADMPGVGPEGIDVRYEQGFLVIHGQVRRQVPDRARLLLREYGLGDYRRDFRVGDAIDPDGIQAEFEDGVLTVRLPKADRVRARKIEVRSK